MIDAVEFEFRGVVVGLLRTNCWIIGSRRRGEACVLDPGGDPHLILDLAKDLGVKITRIIATHAHFDHVLSAGAIKDATGAPFLFHRDDLRIFAGVPATVEKVMGGSAPPMPDPDAYLSDGDNIEVDGVTLKVIHTPGHTMGSISLYEPTAGFLFSGDTLFYETIGRSDFGGDARLMDQSIRQKLLTLPPETRVQPGHGKETTIGHEQIHNPFVGARAGR
jgi:glyoxylase-like metal-dependent hydrolase (beta-lactamase superfamily II)